MRKVILVMALLLAFARPVAAVDPFIITDIRVEGLERLDAGTVFNYLPLKVGDEANDEEISLSIKELFATGFFRDVSLNREGDTLVVNVVERPSIASVDIVGNDEVDDAALEQGLEQAGVVAGRIFNSARMETVEREIKALYLSMGRYSATVDTEVEELEDNRVDVTLNINEGRAARIQTINIIGAEQVDVDDLKDQMLLKDKRGFNPFSRKDQYSKQQLEADLEVIRSYYLDRGFRDFEIVSSNVQVSQNKQNIFISITLDEGDVFTFGNVAMEGADEARLAGLDPLAIMAPGETFSSKKVSAARAAISDRFADDGYAFVEVRPVFEADREAKVVNTVFSVIPNQRVYVRRINISGNLYTRDEVIRRELRQFEGAWYSASAISRSKDRLQRMGIFGDVQIETPEVPGTPDQVDMEVVVSERDTGSLLFSAGYSGEDGVLFGAEFEQRNLFGTGRDLAIKANDSESTNTVEFSYTNPYHTEDGISRGIDVSRQTVDAEDANTAAYVQNTSSLRVFYQIPVAETNSVNLALALENVQLDSTADTPEQFLTVIEANPDADNVVLTTGFSRDTRDDFFFPTRGSTGSVSLELAIPGSDIEYYKLNLSGAWWRPLGDKLTFKASLGLGYGDGYGDTTGLPFFKHYFAGGTRTVRGYDARSLGPRDSGPNSNVEETIGGDVRILTNLELLFPAYGGGGNKDKRLGIFVDGGQVFGNEDIMLGDMRWSAGVFFNWFSAVGPFSISYAMPFNDEAGDDIEELQISLGTVFR